MTTPTDIVASLCAYAVEGGLDGRYQPATIYNALISLGRIEPPGDALRLWEGYEDLLTAAAAAGVRRLRLELSWARLEPRRGQYRDEVTDRYRSLLRSAQALGLEVEIAACDGAWPAWCGMEPLLWPWSLAVVRHHIERIATDFSSADGIIVLARPGSLAQGYLDASGPPWRHKARDDAALVMAHYETLVRETTQRGWLRPVFGPERIVRPLVGGVGPLAQPLPLMEHLNDSWCPTAS